MMCTALTAGHKGLEECKKRGATDHLLKPYDRTRMIAIIEQYCGDKVGPLMLLTGNGATMA